MEYMLNYLPDNIREHYILSFMHGSYVYGTNTEKSDKDIIVIVDDEIDLSSYYNNIYEIETDNYDFQIINNKTFITMIKNHHIIALESLFMQDDFYSDINKFNNLYKSLFKLDKWKLRQVISAIVGNSYAKCHKKLVVEKDYDLYRAQKSIFHCIRLYMFGIQLASMGSIYDYSEANNYLAEIRQLTDWTDIKEKYKPLLNNLRSQLVTKCPKPND